MLNRGISFGVWPGIPVWVIVLVLLGLLVYVVVPAGAGKMRELWGRVGLGLIILGGAGNLVSRLMYGGVIDNLNFFGLFYNNIWDWMIGVGVGIYLFKR